MASPKRKEPEPGESSAEAVLSQKTAAEERDEFSEVFLPNLEKAIHVFGPWAHWELIKEFLGESDRRELLERIEVTCKACWCLVVVLVELWNPGHALRQSQSRSTGSSSH